MLCPKSMKSCIQMATNQMVASRNFTYNLPETTSTKFQFMRKSPAKPNQNLLPVERPKTERIRTMPPSNRNVAVNRMPANYYQLLGVQHNAVAKDIKSAYYELAKMYHPDAKSKRDSAAKLKFVEIQEAYEVLSDEASRSEYDVRVGGRRKVESFRPPQRVETFQDKQSMKTHTTTGESRPEPLDCVYETSSLTAHYVPPQT